MFRLPRTPMSLLVGLQISKFTKSGSRSLTKEAVFKWAARLLTRRSATSVAPSFSLFLFRFSLSIAVGLSRKFHVAQSPSALHIVFLTIPSRRDIIPRPFQLKDN